MTDICSNNSQERFREFVTISAGNMTEHTVDFLIKEGYETPDSLALIREEDLKDFKIPSCQKNVLRIVAEEMKKPHEDSMETKIRTQIKGKRTCGAAVDNTLIQSEE